MAVYPHYFDSSFYQICTIPNKNQSSEINHRFLWLIEMNAPNPIPPAPPQKKQINNKAKYIQLQIIFKKFNNG